MALDQTILERKPYRILSHILFWTVIVASLTIVFGIKHEQYMRSFQDTLLYLPAEMLLTYISIYILIPRYLLKGKIGPFFIGFFFFFILSGLLARTVQHFIINPLNHPYYASFPFFYLEKILRNLVVPITIAGLASSIKLFKLWVKDNEDKLNLQQEKLEAELKFLKAQIHPHFLFNTLNNLYSFTLRNSKDSPSIVLKLSELLQYMLYDCNSEYVSLEKELKSLETYIELEKLRYGKRVDISYTVSGNPKEWKIAPLLLIPFIENSFTHGVSESMENSWLVLDIVIEDSQLRFKLSNSIHNQESKPTKGNIGLRNVRKRLDLIYPNNYSLEVISEDAVYLVILNLKLIRNHAD